MTFEISNELQQVKEHVAECVRAVLLADDGFMPIAEYQAIQWMLADSATELFAARLMTCKAADWDAGKGLKEVPVKVSMAKLFASEMAGRVVDRVLQIFGGRGYMRENPVERFYRDLRIDRIWEGTSEIQRLVIARQLLKRGARRICA
jgi:acyl-CoA dehydrogenase